MNNKLFISGRVSGLKPDTVRKNFARVEKKYKAIGYEVINPTKLCKKEWSWIRCMAVCLWNLAKCEYVYMIPNYKQSRGAKFELCFANLLGKTVVFGWKV